MASLFTILVTRSTYESGERPKFGCQAYCNGKLEERAKAVGRRRQAQTTNSLNTLQPLGMRPPTVFRTEWLNRAFLILAAASSFALTDEVI